MVAKWSHDRTFFSANDAVCPPWTSLTGILLRWMDLTVMGMKTPSGSGPKSSVSLSRINPRNVVPETTVPTPCQEKTNIKIHLVLEVFFFKCFVLLASRMYTTPKFLSNSLLYWVKGPRSTWEWPTVPPITIISLKLKKISAIQAFRSSWHIRSESIAYKFDFLRGT